MLTSGAAPLGSEPVKWLGLFLALSLAGRGDEQTRSQRGVLRHRYRDSNPGFRTENPAS
jgi:hypothetical protein